MNPDAETTTLSAGEKRRILRDRARALAHVPTALVDAETRLEVIEFVLANERYGLETAFVREVYPLKDLTPLPCTPAFVRGVINVRGQILTVIDLKKFFELPEKGLADLHRVIIVRSKTVEFGILADSVLSVRTIPASALQKTLRTLTGTRGAYLKGVTADQLVVLDADKIVTDERLVVHEEVAG